MFNNENDFEKLISRLNIDYKPNPAHRKNLREQMLSVFNEKTRKTVRPTIRTIMKIPITRIAAAAVIVVGIVLLSQQWGSTNGKKSSIYFGLLSQACAAERSLFFQDGIAHIVNEIIVYSTSEMLHSEEQDFDTSDSFLEYKWLPMCSVKANGQLRFNQLQLSADSNEPYTIVDESWYDSATGYFARVLKLDEEVFFANSYDGQFVYNSETAPDGSFHLIKEQEGDDFAPPQNPAEFLGIAAGLRSGIDEERDPLVQGVSDGILDDGTAVSIVKVGFPKPSGELTAYWLFMIRKDDSTIAEMEFIIANQPQLLIRRVLSESVTAPDVSWNLAALPAKVIERQGKPKAKILPDMVIPNVSVQHMVERASFETYIFATKPPWTGPVEIIDCIDPASFGKRMFIFASRADDGRHLVLVQSPTYNKMLGNFAKMGDLVYTSPNGFKVWGGGPQKWYSKILLSSARATIKDPPSEDRVGFILESPAGTLPSLAVNGPLSDEELHNLIDSLIPAKEYQQD